MAFSPPRLDDRRFDDLVEDLLARIPAHTPEWTNPRLGDPGRTLIELFAWLGDALLYRANLVPERQRLVFLSLLGQQLQPARAARGIVQLSYAQPAAALTVQTLRPGATVSGAQPFETLAAKSVLPLSGEAYVKRALSPVERARIGEVVTALARIHRVAGTPEPYETHRVFDAERAEPAGSDVFAAAQDRALWFALLAPLAEQPELQAGVNATVREAIGGGAGSAGGLPALISLGIVPATRPPELFDDLEDPAPLPLIWEIATQGRGRFDTEYLTLEPVAGSDTTAGYTKAGTLELALPETRFLWVPSNDAMVNPGAGVGDAPPRIDDAERAARLVAWLRLRPRPGADVRSLKLAWAGINAVEVDQRVTLRGQVLGASTGQADQEFALPQGSADADTLLIDVEEPGRGWQPWRRVDDLGAISPDPFVARESAVYELDAAAGRLRLGDGVRGRVPDRGMRIRLREGRFGGGTAGNLPALSLTAISGTLIDGARPAPMKITQPLATEGGVDAETLPQAERRIPALLRHRDRAVTAQDHERLAFEVPAVAMGRVQVLPRFKPRDRRPDVPGVVSVMVLPDAPLPAVPGGANPRPDRPFLERVHSHLAARVPLATELYVIGCEYIALALAVGVALREGFARDTVVLEVKQALLRLLWPLPNATIATGWPLGQDVRERELEVEISRVAGVREVLGINMFGKGAGETGPAWALLPRAGDGTRRLTLADWQLPELLAVVVLVDDGRGGGGVVLPTTLGALPNPFAKATAVAVPVVPALC